MTWTFVEKRNFFLQNTFVLSALISRDTTAGDSPFNPLLGHRCPVVTKGSVLNG